LELNNEYIKPDTVDEDDTFPQMTISIFLHENVNLLETSPNIDKILDVIKNNCAMWDLEYGSTDIYLSAFKIKNFNSCKNEIKKLSKINDFKIKTLKVNYYD